MAWTYNSTNVGSSSLATIRFYVGDTSSSDQLVLDGEITGIRDNLAGNDLAAAVIVLDSLSAQFARFVDTDNEGLSVKASQRATAFAARAQQLRLQGWQTAELFVGGRSLADKEDRREDSDYVQPSFERGRDDFPSRDPDAST